MSVSSLMARAVWKVVSRRRQNGPLRPSWSLPLEVAHELLRLHLANATAEDPARTRQFEDSLGAAIPSLALRKMSRQSETLHGVEGTWLKPRGSTPREVLLYLHGGGYCMGSIATHGDLVAKLAQAASVNTFTPHYRLAPEHPFPAALDDALAAYQGLLEKGYQPRQIVVGGDSAGGGLSVALLLRLRDAGLPLPAGALLISPWVDLTCSMQSVVDNTPYDFGDRKLLMFWADHYRGSKPATDPLISPLYAELSGLPPLCIFAGEVELLVDEARALHEKALAAKVISELICAPDMAHDYPMMHLLSQSAKDAIQHAARFMNDVCASSEKAAR